MTHAWDILRLVAVAEHTDAPSTGSSDTVERRTERITRVSVVAESRCGSAMAFHGPDDADLDALISQAVHNAATGPIRPTDSASDKRTAAPVINGIPDHADLVALSWLEPGGTDHQHVDYTRQQSTGFVAKADHAETWHRQSIAGYPVGRVPEGASLIEARRPSHDPSCWLIPPIVLSQLLLDPLLNAVTGRAQLRRWPSDSLVDPAWGGGQDYEGTPRLPTVLAHHGALITLAADRRSAWARGTQPTGHSGLGGAVIRDLVMIGRCPAMNTLPPGAIVAQATRMASGLCGDDTMFALRTLNPRGIAEEPALITVRDVADLLDAGTWCGPFQRGLGPWTSRWLAIGTTAL